MIAVSKSARSRSARPSKSRKPAAGKLLGNVIVGMYPEHPYIGIKQTLKPRRLLVESINVDAPTAEELRLDPLLMRGNTLITGRDLDRNEECELYLENFKDWKAITIEKALATGPHPCVVVVVETPKGWKPKEVGDVPPGVVIHPQANDHLARVFAARFNQLELEEKKPTGRWAIAPAVKASK